MQRRETDLGRQDDIPPSSGQSTMPDNTEKDNVSINNTAVCTEMTQASQHELSMCNLFVATPETDPLTRPDADTLDTPRATRDMNCDDTSDPDGECGEGQGLLEEVCQTLANDNTADEGSASIHVSDSVHDSDSDYELDYIGELAINGGFDPDEVKGRVSVISNRKAQTAHGNGCRTDQTMCHKNAASKIDSRLRLTPQPRPWKSECWTWPS